METIEQVKKLIGEITYKQLRKEFSDQFIIQLANLTEILNQMRVSGNEYTKGTVREIVSKYTRYSTFMKELRNKEIILPVKSNIITFQKEAISIKKIAWIIRICRMHTYQNNARHKREKVLEILDQVDISDIIDYLKDQGYVIFNKKDVL